MSSKKIEIVVLGGGAFGSQLVFQLAPHLDPSKHNLTLINNRPFWQHLISAIRQYVTSDGHLEEQALIPYDGVFGSKKVGSFKQGIAEKVDFDEKVIKLVGGEQVKFDYLVLATGSKWEGPLDLPAGGPKQDSVDFLNAWRERVANATSVVIIGGGAVGIETAGEIKDYYPSTKITLIHSESLLINKSVPDGFRKRLAKKLKALGVDVILNDYLEIPDELVGTRTIKTRNGANITADLFIPSRGPKPNTSYLPSSFLTSDKRVPVFPSLQVRNYPYAFAMGDIISWPESKMASKAMAQVPLIQKNLLAVLNGQAEEKKLKKYNGFLEGWMFVTLGRFGGSGVVPLFWGLYIILGNWIVGNVKSNNLMVTGARSQIGAPAVKA